MTTVKDALNALKWRDDALEDAVITYVHRGAPGDVRVVRGGDVVDLHASFMEIRSRGGTTMIPYHRIRLVERGDRVVWARERDARAGA